MSKNNTVTCTHTSANPKAAMELIESLAFNMMDLGMTPIPIMMWGQPGVGKSSIVKQIAKKHNRPVIDIRLLLRDPTDLAGLPFFNVNKGVLEITAPVGFPVEGCTDWENLQRAVIILDELSAAPKAVQAAALQLILDREIGNYKLPKDVIIIAAGNRSTDGSVFEEMPTPLRNRFAHIDVTPDFTQWKEWAVESKIHPMVMGFLEANQAEFNTFDGKNVIGRYAFSTPRIWEFVSNALWSISNEDLQVPAEKKPLMSKIVGSLVGIDVAATMMVYSNVFQGMPTPNEILDKKMTHNFDTGEVKHRQSARYACVIGLVHVMSERFQKAKEKGSKEVDSFMEKEAVHFVHFMLNSMAAQEEFLALAVNRLVAAQVPAFKAPCFREYITKIAPLVKEM